MYKTKHFEIFELVPKDLLENWPVGKEANMWFLFDNRTLITGDRLRNRYKKTIVNTYHWGGINQYRGWRPYNCPIGADHSQHKYGRSLDLIFTDVTAEEVREDIKKHPDRPEFEFITCIEIGIGWFHFGVRNWNKDRYGILEIMP